MVRQQLIFYSPETLALLPRLLSNRHYDAIVVGLGAMGSATLCHLEWVGVLVASL
jgi:hypothetical protein